MRRLIKATVVVLGLSLTIFFAGCDNKQNHDEHGHSHSHDNL